MDVSHQENTMKQFLAAALVATALFVSGASVTPSVPDVYACGGGGD